MASILSRFTSIIKANINELLDKAEDPEKMVDQYLRELAEDLAEVKEATAGVMAEEKRCQRALRENEDKAEHYEDLAKAALPASSWPRGRRSPASTRASRPPTTPPTPTPTRCARCTTSSSTTSSS